MPVECKPKPKGHTRKMKKSDLEVSAGKSDTEQRSVDEHTRLPIVGWPREAFEGAGNQPGELRRNAWEEELQNTFRTELGNKGALDWPGGDSLPSEDEHEAQSEADFSDYETATEDELEGMDPGDAVEAYKKIPHRHLPTFESRPARPWVEPLMSLLNMGMPYLHNLGLGKPLLGPLPEKRTRVTALAVYDQLCRPEEALETARDFLNQASNRETIITALNRALNELAQSSEKMERPAFKGEGSFHGVLARGRDLSAQLEATFGEVLSEAQVFKVLEYFHHYISVEETSGPSSMGRETGRRYSAPHTDRAGEIDSNHACEAALPVASGGASVATPLLPLTLAGAAVAAVYNPSRIKNLGWVCGAALITGAMVGAGRRLLGGDSGAGVGNASPAPAETTSVPDGERDSTPRHSEATSPSTEAAPYTRAKESAPAETTPPSYDSRNREFQQLQEMKRIFDQLEVPYLDFLFYGESIGVEEPLQKSDPMSAVTEEYLAAETKRKLGKRSIADGLHPDDREVTVKQWIKSLQNTIGFASSRYETYFVQSLQTEVDGSREMIEAAERSSHERDVIYLVKSIEILEAYFNQPERIDFEGSERVRIYLYGLWVIANSLSDPYGEAKVAEYKQLFLTRPSTKRASDEGTTKTAPQSLEQWLADPKRLESTIEQKIDAVMQEVLELYDPVLIPSEFIDNHIWKKIHQHYLAHPDDQSQDRIKKTGPKTIINIVYKAGGFDPEHPVPGNAVRPEVDVVVPTSLRDIVTGQYIRAFKKAPASVSGKFNRYELPQEVRALINTLTEDDLQALMFESLSAYRNVNADKMQSFYKNNIILRCLEYLSDPNRLPAYEQAIRQFLAGGLQAQEVMYQNTKVNGVFFVPAGGAGGVLFSVDESKFFHVHRGPKTYRAVIPGGRLKSEKVYQFPTTKEFKAWVLNKMPAYIAIPLKTSGDFDLNVEIKGEVAGNFVRMSLSPNVRFNPSQSQQDLASNLFGAFMDRLQSDIDQLMFSQHEQDVEKNFEFIESILLLESLAVSIAMPGSGNFLKAVVAALANFAVNVEFSIVDLVHANMVDRPQDAEQLRRQAYNMALMAGVNAILDVKGVQGLGEASVLGGLYQRLKSAAGVVVENRFSRVLLTDLGAPAEILTREQLELLNSQRTKYRGNIAKVKEKYPAEFARGERNSESLQLEGYDSDMSELELTQLYNDPDVIITAEQRGKLHVLIEEARNRRLIDSSLFVAAKYSEILGQNSDRAIIAPQTFLLTAAGASEKGRCVSMVLALAVALKNNKSAGFFSNLYRAAAHTEGPNRKMIRALDILHGAGAGVASHLRTIDFGAGMQAGTIKGIVKEAAAASDTSLYQMYTSSHAMMVGVTIDNAGVKIFHFYDPNSGLFSYPSAKDLLRAMQRTVGTEAMAEQYAAFGTLNEPRYRLSRIDTEGLGEMSLADPDRPTETLTVQDLSEEEVPAVCAASGRLVARATRCNRLDAAIAKFENIQEAILAETQPELGSADFANEYAQNLTDENARHGGVFDKDIASLEKAKGELGQFSDQLTEGIGAGGKEEARSLNVTTRAA